MMSCVLPAQRDKPNKEWINDNRLEDQSIASFASTMLTIIPIIIMLLDRFPQVAHYLPDHVACYKKLYDILWILRCDAHGKRIDLLRHLIEEHHKMWARLYPESAKPKLHQLLHVPQGIAYLGKVIACFTCERKHREVKRTAVNVYRHFEHTTIVDMLHSMCEELSEHDLFAEQTLVRCEHKVVIGSLELLTADSCLCHCGEITRGDVIAFESGTAAKVSSFWKHPYNHDIAVQCMVLSRVHDSTDVYHESSDVIFCPVRKIIDAVPYFPMDGRMLRVGMPPSCVFY